MSISQLIEQDILKSKWSTFKAYADEMESLKGRISASIIELESDELYLENASDEEKELVAKYK